MDLDLVLQTPWTLPHAPERFAAELSRELSPEHLLFAKRVRAIGIRQDRDDVLFEVNESGSVSYAVVHLTWTGHQERGVVPNSIFFETLEAVREQMNADHIDFECLD
jgi:hypothetical protein